MMKNWNGWWILLFGLCTFMLGAMLKGTLLNAPPKPILWAMFGIFGLLSFGASVSKKQP